MVSFQLRHLHWKLEIKGQRLETSLCLNSSNSFSFFPEGRLSAQAAFPWHCRAKQRHHSLALYILIRGVTLLVRCGNKPESPPLVRKLLAPSRFQHGDTALMCASLSQLGYSWIILPQTLPSSYVKFLNHHGGKQPYIYAAIAVRSSTLCNQHTSQALTCLCVSISN